MYTCSVKSDILQMQRCEAHNIPISSLHANVLKLVCEIDKCWLCAASSEQGALIVVAGSRFVNWK